MVVVVVVVLDAAELPMLLVGWLVGWLLVADRRCVLAIYLCKTKEAKKAKRTSSLFFWRESSCGSRVQSAACVLFRGVRR